MCSRDSILALRSVTVRHGCNVISRLSLRRRGCRAGKRCRLRLLAAQTVHWWSLTVAKAYTYRLAHALND